MPTIQVKAQKSSRLGCISIESQSESIELKSPVKIPSHHLLPFIPTALLVLVSNNIKSALICCYMNNNNCESSVLSECYLCYSAAHLSGRLWLEKKNAKKYSRETTIHGWRVSCASIQKLPLINQPFHSYGSRKSRCFVAWDVKG